MGIYDLMGEYLVDTRPIVDEEMPPWEWYNQTDYKSNYSFILPFETSWDRHGVFPWYRKYGLATAYLAAPLYVIGIWLGQKLMAYREHGFKLKWPLVLFNFGLAIFSILGFCRSSPALMRILYRFGFEDSVCVGSWSQDHVAATWMVYFVWSKYVEWVDTLFLILRKRPVTFLHWYHHVTVMVFCWHGSHAITAAGLWYAVMNYGVHSIMYSYFAWRSLGFGCPRWISMIITIMQTAQMVVGIALGITIYNVKSSSGGQCHAKWSNLYMAIAIYSTYLYLFCRYFYFAYIRRSTSPKPAVLSNLPCVMDNQQTAPETEKVAENTCKPLEHEEEDEKEEQQFHFVIASNKDEYEYYMKKFELENQTKNRRKRKSKQFDGDKPLITDAYVKKRA